MPTYNLIEYCKHHSMTSGSLLNYFRDRISDDTNENNYPNKNLIESNSFKYKTSITGKLTILMKGILMVMLVLIMI